MKMRVLKWITGWLLGVVIILVALVLLLVRTEFGAGWVLDLAKGQTEGLEIGGHRGSIHGGLELQAVRFESDGVALSVDELSLAIDGLVSVCSAPRVARGDEPGLPDR